MKIHLNKTRINKIKNIAKKCVLAGSMSAIIISSPILKTDVKAIDSININDEGIGYYELSDDNIFLYLEQASNLEIVEQLPNLKEVYICDSNIEDTESLKNSNISSITFKNCNLCNSNIELPTSLTEVQFDNTKFEDFTNLNNIKNLKVLTFKNCEFDNLQCISKANSITSLDFDSCNVGSLNGIEKLTNLKNLSFIYTGIESIEKISNLSNLESLTLNHTFVSDISPIKNLDLSYLDISNSSKIKNLDIITNMKNLNTLLATNCEMSYTKNIIEYLKNNNVYTNITEEGLEIQKQIKQLSNNIIKDKSTEEEKIKEIVSYVIDNMEYDYRIYENQELKDEYSNNALKYALLGKGHCKNFTAFTTALLIGANINVYEQQNDDHIWNLVKLEDNNYYYLDTTFIDEENIDDIYMSENFMTREDDFLLTHNSILLPSSIYNQVHNLNTEETNIEGKQVAIPKKSIKKILSKKNVSLGATIGILSSLGAAFLSKKINNSKTKERKKNI